MILVLGLADLMAGVIFIASAFLAELPWSMVVFFAVYLIIKGGIFLLFFTDWGSAFDVIGGAVLLLSIFLSIPGTIFVLFGTALAIKGFLSVIA